MKNKNRKKNASIFFKKERRFWKGNSQNKGQRRKILMDWSAVVTIPTHF